MPDGLHKEFNKDMVCKLGDFSGIAGQGFSEKLYAYGDENIDELSEKLGIKWEESKTTPFSFTVIYLGFLWDLENQTVAVPEQKQDKYLAADTPTSVLGVKQTQTKIWALQHASILDKGWRVKVRACSPGFKPTEQRREKV